MVFRSLSALTPAQRIGADAERRAVQLLTAAGLKVIERNARNRFGELDVIALDDATLVITEVRARAASRFGGAAGSVGPRKQQRVIRATQAWLAAHAEHQHRDVRFDVVAVEGDAAPRWIRGAFWVEGR